MSAGPRSRIYATGSCTPDLVVTNDDLAEIMDTNDEWIEKRSGIRRRRYVNDGQGSVGMAEKAARQALGRAGLEPADIGLVICATISPDIDIPRNAHLLQDRLGIPGIPVFDVYNQCSGFIYSVALADQYIRTGGAKYVLVVGSEVHSTGLEFTDRGRNVSVLFGDAAGAVVVGPCDDPDRGLITINLHSEGAHAEKLCCIGPGASRKPRIYDGCLEDDDTYMWAQMDGRFVFRHAVTRMCEAIREAVDDVSVSVDDINMLVPHQANLRINQFVAHELKLGEDRVANNIENYANTTAATIPLLLDETLAAGRIKEGDLVCLAAFGAGFTWGAALLRW